MFDVQYINPINNSPYKDDSRTAFGGFNLRAGEATILKGTDPIVSGRMWPRTKCTIQPSDDGTYAYANQAIDSINKAITDKDKQFLGDIKQIPPVFSALKVDGTRAYIRARKNEDVTMPPREVHIHEFEITHAGIPETSFRVLCSKGTYIRSLAYDFGKFLKSGAYIQNLHRTRIGNFRIEDAVSIPDLEKIIIRQIDK